MQAIKFVINKIVQPEHIDENLHVNNLVHLRWAQEISGKHWQAATKHQNIDHLTWVVAKQEIEYLKELQDGDEVRIETYISEVIKHKTIRVIDFFRADIIVAKCRIHWALLNQENKKPMRVPAEFIQLFFECPI